MIPWTLLINTNNVLSVTNFGAIGDGVTTNTTAIQNAIKAAAAGGATNGGSGGTVEIPKGTFLCGPLTLSNCINLQLDAGAILRMLPFGAYPVTWYTNGSNIYFTANNFISASHLHDVEISGTGAIDGQGLPWWPWANTNNAVRPIMIAPSSCTRLLIQNVTLSNSPMFHIAISGAAGNSTVQGVTVLAPSSTANPPSHNTDACDVSGTNILVQNCNISTGDDDFTCGGGTSGVLLTNNTYGNGHGISIGSYTDDGGVSNITVMNCTMNGTLNGIRIKSDDGRGGLVQNISYYNIGMTNVDFPIQVYGYYNEVGTPNSISTLYAATQAVAAVTSTTPIYRNITFSNINATAVSGYPAIIVWPRTELPGTNLVFNRVNISASLPVEIYNAANVQFIDSKFTVPSGIKSFELFDAQVVISNSVPTNLWETVDGLTTNGYGSTLSLFNTTASLQNTNLFDNGPLAMGSSTLTISNNLTLFPSTVLNYFLGTNQATVSVVSNLVLGGTINITNTSGFTGGTFTLLTYGKTLSGSLPTLGVTPTNFVCQLSTNIAGQINLIATLPAPTNLVAAATNLQINLKWNAVAGAASYNLKRGTTNGIYSVTTSGITITNDTDTTVSPGVTYYYVVSAVVGSSESSNSISASASPLPSAAPVTISYQFVGTNWKLAWPADHLGWELQAQTNRLTTGLGTNWTMIQNSQSTNQITIPINPDNASVFLRLVYP